jgi:hypothetical protein
MFMGSMFVPTGMLLLACCSTLVNSFSKAAILQLTLYKHCISCTVDGTGHQFGVHIPMCDRVKPCNDC